MIYKAFQKTERPCDSLRHNRPALPRPNVRISALPHGAEATAKADERLNVMDAAVAYGGQGDHTLTAKNSIIATLLFGDEGNDALVYASNDGGVERASLFGGGGTIARH